MFIIPVFYILPFVVVVVLKWSLVTVPPSGEDWHSSGLHRSGLCGLEKPTAGPLCPPHCTGSSAWPTRGTLLWGFINVRSLYKPEDLRSPSLAASLSLATQRLATRLPVCEFKSDPVCFPWAFLFVRVVLICCRKRVLCWSQNRNHVLSVLEDLKWIPRNIELQAFSKLRKMRSFFSVLIPNIQK